MSKMIKVSFQGERGAYSESAAKEFFDKEIETVPLPTFADVLDSTAQDKTDFSVLPVENSIEGSVGESYDLLYSTTLNAVGEIYYKIRHCLIGNSTLDKIDTVYSHPQALGQCRNFIQKQKIKFEFLRIGLQFDGNKWSLSGIDGLPIVTTVATTVWVNARESVKVPARMVLGKQVSKRLDYTIFENKGK